jgi:hypothetical protein
MTTRYQRGQLTGTKPLLTLENLGHGISAAARASSHAAEQGDELAPFTLTKLHSLALAKLTA